MGRWARLDGAYSTALWTEGCGKMTAHDEVTARKRAVTSALSEDLVAQASLFTDDLAATVEMLLNERLAREHRREQQKSSTRERLAAEAAALWNVFESQAGSFADEHSTLG
jgi:hypothetical protein